MKSIWGVSNIVAPLSSLASSASRVAALKSLLSNGTDEVLLQKDVMENSVTTFQVVGEGVNILPVPVRKGSGWTILVHVLQYSLLW